MPGTIKLIGYICLKSNSNNYGIRCLLISCLTPSTTHSPLWFICPASKAIPQSNSLPLYVHGHNHYQQIQQRLLHKDCFCSPCTWISTFYGHQQWHWEDVSFEHKLHLAHLDSGIWEALGDICLWRCFEFDYSCSFYVYWEYYSVYHWLQTSL